MMSDADASAFFTPEAIKRWEKEKDRLEGILAETQRKLGAVHSLLRAATILGPAAISEEEPEDVQIAEETTPAEEPESSNMMGMIRQFANESVKPITKSEMKSKLVAAGIPDNRLGSYFYVAIDRLKKKDKITVLDDGRIWKAA
jgi:hypothetical protein